LSSRGNGTIVRLLTTCGNGHLQVVHEILSKQLYETIWFVYSGELGGEVGTRCRVCHGGRVGWVQGEGECAVIYYF